MWIVKVVAGLLMVAGLIGTLLPRVPGMLIMAAGIVVIGFFSEFRNFTLVYSIAMTVLLVAAEGGGRILRRRLTQSISITREFAADAATGGVAALIVSDLLFGPTIGTLIWELLIGKTLVPRGRVMLSVLLRLAGAALFRFVVGLIIIIWTVVQIF